MAHGAGRRVNDVARYKALGPCIHPMLTQEVLGECVGPMRAGNVVDAAVWQKGASCACRAEFFQTLKGGKQDGRLS